MNYSAPVAQWIERSPPERKAAGSNPVRCIKFLSPERLAPAIFYGSIPCYFQYVYVVYYMNELYYPIRNRVPIDNIKSRLLTQPALLIYILFIYFVEGDQLLQVCILSHSTLLGSCKQFLCSLRILTN